MRYIYFSFIFIKSNCTEYWPKTGDVLLGATQENSKFLKNLKECARIINENNKNNIFKFFYESMFGLTPSVFSIEDDVTKYTASKGGFLESLYNISELDYIIEQIVGIKIYGDYWYSFKEGIILELSSIWMGKVLGKMGDLIGLSIRKGDIFKKINKKNYKYKNLVLREEVKSSLEKIYFVLNLKSRQKLVYVVGKPGTGKTTVMINQMIKLGYEVYYVNGNTILLSDYSDNTIIQVLESLKREILSLSIKKRNKTVLIFDECEVAMKDVGQVEEKLRTLRGKNDVVSKISQGQMEKEKALTSFMLSMFSLDSLPVICISNTLDISPYMQRRITHLENFDLETIENYRLLWEEFLTIYKISFIEGPLEKIIFSISLFSLKNKISIRTIKQFSSIFRGKKLSVKTLFDYCVRLEE